MPSTIACRPVADDIAPNVTVGIRTASLVVALVSFSGAAPNAQSDEGRTLLFFVDDLHLDFRSTPPARESMKRLLRAVSEGDRIAVVSTGASSVSEPPTTDRAVLDRAISRIVGGGARPEEIVSGVVSPRELAPRAEVALTTAAAVLRRLQLASFTSVLRMSSAKTIIGFSCATCSSSSNGSKR